MTRVAVVTGGSAGLGRATVRELAARGWDVAVLARGKDGVDAAVAEVEAAGDQVVLEAGDAQDGREADELAGFADLPERLGVEDTVFKVDEGPLEAGGGEDANDFRRGEVAEVCTKLHFAFVQRFFDLVDEHYVWLPGA